MLRPGKRDAGASSLSVEQRAEEPPRLILRVAIFAAIGLALAAAGILLVVRHLSTAQAERAAAFHARFIADSFLREELQPADFAAPVVGPRRVELDELLDGVLVDGMLLVTLFGRDGTVTYSNDHGLIGTVSGDAGRIQQALAGEIVSDVTSIGQDGGRSETKALRAHLPIPFDDADETGTVAFYQDYAPIAEAAKQAFFPVAGVLEVALLGLYAMLFPVMRRASRRIRRQMAEIEHLGLHDDLTGLPNRALFRDRVQQALLSANREGAEVAVMLIDLDRFKEINDALGHRSGDILLEEFGSRLRAVLRENETFARLGGDEFAVLIPRGTAASVIEVVNRIRAVLEKPFIVDGLPLAVEASVGVATYPSNGNEVDVLIQRADVAMYLAKEARSGYALYTAETDPNDPARLSLLADMRRAIDQSELVLHFQPKADLGSGAIRGVEVLLRWQHPERGLLPPGEFMPLAERTGLIKPLTRYVIEGALAQWRDWKSQGIDLRVAVNITVPNLLDLEFTDEVAELLRCWGVGAGSLEFEITENTMMADPVRVQQVLAQLSAMGVRLAIDDFGSGYSSLSYLKQLPVDQLKIDRSFLPGLAADSKDWAIVRSTIELGRNLGLEVVAEGVETEQIWEALGVLGCDCAQGYFIGGPVPADEITARLAGAAAVSRLSEAERETRDADRGEPSSTSPARQVETTRHGLRVVAASGR